MKSVFDDGEIYHLARKHDITDHDDDWACDERVLDFAYEVEQLVCKKMAEDSVTKWQRAEPNCTFVLCKVQLESQLFDHVYNKENEK